MTSEGRGLGSDPADSLALRGFIVALLIGSFFSIWIGASDPWWRSKEWWVLIVGCGWWATRNFFALRPARDLKSSWIGWVLVWLTVQMVFFQVLPIVASPGRILTNPWAWIGFLHIVIIATWFSDGFRILSLEDFSIPWRVVAWIGFVLSLLMISQALGFDPVVKLIELKRGPVRWLHDNHVVGLMGNPFQAGTVLAVCVPAMTLFPWMIGIGLLALVLTKSAISILATFFGLLTYLWLTGRRFWVWLSLMAAGISLWVLPKTFFSFSGRFELWAKSWEVWKKHFLFGVGLSQYKLQGITASTGNGAPNNVWWAHSEWLQIGCEFGLIGLLLAVAGFLLLMLKSRKGIPPVLAGTFATLFVLSLGSIPFHLAPTIVVTLLAILNWLVWEETNHER